MKSAFCGVRKMVRYMHQYRSPEFGIKLFKILRIVWGEVIFALVEDIMNITNKYASQNTGMWVFNQ